MSITLWSPHGNGRATKILLAAEIAKVQLQHKHIDYENLKTPEHLARHPLGRVPVLQTPEGYIHESFSILRYIARKSNSIFGKNAWEQAEIQNWLNSTLYELDPFVSDYVMCVAGYEPQTKEKFNQITKLLKEWSKNLDENLKGKSYLVGDQLTIADIAIASSYYWLFRLLLDDKARTQLPNLLAWYQKVSTLQEFQNVIGKTWYTQKEFVPVSFVEEQEKKVEKQKAEKPEKAEKTEKPKAEKKQPKVQEKKQEKKEQKKKDKKKKDSDAEEEEQKPVQKKVNPLDLLPKSPFVLDDFKRQISNNPDKSASVKAFWQKYDAQGWSLWKSVYDKYEGEGTVGYLTSNLKNGFLRNLDHFRKYAFAGFGVYGAQNNFDIKGVWLWRGTEIPEQIKDHQSYEYYKWTKLDHNKEEDRKLLQEYWTQLQEGQLVEGVPVFDVKYFK